MDKKLSEWYAEEIEVFDRFLRDDITLEQVDKFDKVFGALCRTKTKNTLKKYLTSIINEYNILKEQGD